MTVHGPHPIGCAQIGGANGPIAQGEIVPAICNCGARSGNRCDCGQRVEVWIDGSRVMVGTRIPTVRRTAE